ncbi:N-acetylated-alpha-linked acidic dipeptidase 2-like isoform X1 [Anabrus simplex]|uniref:N-acetylated-alpha-linked acidic dipeptidase 2-like isoform X1 n=1 Tax=Anabrus simplex TaxID=316456 RepID=UPI0035A30082
MGSQEWVEEHLVELSIRGVAYINTDTCVSGPHLEISASPLLSYMVFDATRMVSHPSKENTTLFDELTNSFKKAEEDLKYEWSDNLSYDSDIGPFLYLAGIPSVNVWFRRNKTQNERKNKFPTYHTAYDTLHRMTNFVDPDYHLHKACTQLSLAMILNAADSPLVPFNPTSLGQVMKKGLEHLTSEEISLKLIRFGVNIGPLRRAVDDFVVAADVWTEQLKTDNFSLPLRRRMLNDQLMLLKNSLLLPEGESSNFRVRHAIYSPAILDSYVTTTFAKIVDLLNEGPEVKTRLNIYITKVMVQIRQAISALTPF